MNPIAIPNSDQLAAAPELAAVAIALAAAHALCHALHAAHPVLRFADASPHPPLDCAERTAAAVLFDAECLADSLEEYAAITLRDNRCSEESSLPF